MQKLLGLLALDLIFFSNQAILAEKKHIHYRYSIISGGCNKDSTDACMIKNAAKMNGASEIEYLCGAEYRKLPAGTGGTFTIESAGSIFSEKIVRKPSPASSEVMVICYFNVKVVDEPGTD